MSASSYVTRSGPKSVLVRDTITRPNDANQYSIGDAISDNTTTPTAAGYFQLPLGGPAGETFVFTDFTLHKSDTDSTSADIALLLFSARPALAGFKDNVALAITDAEMQDCFGAVKFSAAGWLGVATGDVQTVSQNVTFVSTTADQTVYGLLAAAGTYTPAANEVFTLTAKALK